MARLQPLIQHFTLSSYVLPATGEPEGNTAFRVAYKNTGKNVLLQLRKDEISNPDWGWNEIALPNDDEPFNVLFADAGGPKFYVFCSNKVYVSSTADPTNFTSYTLPVTANWDLVCFDGTSITAANKPATFQSFRVIKA